MTEGMRLGVFGGASEGYTEQGLALARSVGTYAAELGLILLTGATHGIPYAAGKAAIAAGGTVLGISPARDAAEHVATYRKPLDGTTHIIWTGLGYTGRNFLNVRNCEVSLFIGGGAGTLEEFCIAIYEGHTIGALTNSGGIAGLLPQIVAQFGNLHGSEVLFGEEPRTLLDSLLLRHAARRTER